MRNMLFLCRLTENHPSGGRLEEYIPSRPLTCHEIAMPNMANQIAKRLARVHQLEEECICDALERWLAQLRQMPSGSLDFDLPVESREWAPSFRNMAVID